MARRVTGERFLHIHRQGPLINPHAPLAPGATLEIGTTINPFYGFFLNHTRVYGYENLDGSQFEATPVQFIKWRRDGLIDVPEQRFSEVAFESVRHFVFLAREIIMEDVRREIAPDAPSRQRCMWATSEDMRPYWSERLDGVMASIEVDGIVHKADASFLLGDSEPLSVTYERARCYWRGDSGERPQWEYLIEGTVRVLAVEECKGTNSPSAARIENSV